MVGWFMVGVSIFGAWWLVFVGGKWPEIDKPNISPWQGMTHASSMITGLLSPWQGTWCLVEVARGDMQKLTSLQHQEVYACTTRMHVFYHIAFRTEQQIERNCPELTGVGGFAFCLLEASPDMIPYANFAIGIGVPQFSIMPLLIGHFRGLFWNLLKGIAGTPSSACFCWQAWWVYYR